MSWYQTLVSSYDRFVGLFPPPIQWLVSLLIIVGVVSALYGLIRHYVLFAIAFIVLVPLAIPVVLNFTSDVAAFIAHAALALHLTKA